MNNLTFISTILYFFSAALLFAGFVKGPSHLMDGIILYIIQSQYFFFSGILFLSASVFLALGLFSNSKK